MKKGVGLIITNEETAFNVQLGRVSVVTLPAYVDLCVTLDVDLCVTGVCNLC